MLEHDVFFFSTFGGEALSLAAGRATLRALEARGVPEQLATVGATIRDGYNHAAIATGADGWTRCVGHPSRTMITFDSTAASPLMLKSLMQQELLRHGVLWSGSNTISAAHTADDVDHLIDAYGAALNVVVRAVESDTVAASLLGDPVEPVFRRTGNFNVRPRVSSR
jgi:glutamate-1-semialdehyde aminotransferase